MIERKELALIVGEDDGDDYLICERALLEARWRGPIFRAKDGEELLDRLLEQGPFAQTPLPSPALVLLDLNMPRKSGLEVLSEARAHPTLRSIPIVVLSNSSAEEDVRRSYALGANSYFTKPRSYVELVRLMTALKDYWLDRSELP